MPAFIWTYVDAINYVGAPVDWEAFAELKANILLLATSEIGDSTFAGPAGQLITLTTPQPDVNYKPSASAMADTGGRLGDVWFTIIDESNFRVHNTGKFTGAMRWGVSR